jgi:hypothetical protein
VTTEPLSLDTANVINLPHRLDRREHIEREAKEKCFKVRFWPGIVDADPRKGCWQAHKQIVRAAKEQGLPYVWICEDDVVLACPGAADYYLAHLPKDYYLYFGGIWQTRYVAGILTHWRGTHCYIVHESFYNKFLRGDESMHIDSYLCQKVNPHKIVLCSPMIAECLDGISDRTGVSFSHQGLRGEGFTLFANSER